MNELPELPQRYELIDQPAEMVADSDGEWVRWRDAQAYALSAVQMERERCAKLVESQKFWVVVPELAETAAQGDVMTDVLNNVIYGPVVAAIRSPLKEGEKK